MLIFESPHPLTLVLSYFETYLLFNNVYSVCSFARSSSVIISHTSFPRPHHTHPTPSSRYTWFTLDTLEEGWQKVQKLVKEREMALLKEAKRQERNDELRKTFAQHANTFHSWLTDVRYRSSWMTSIMFVLHNSVLSRHKIQDIYPPPTHTHRTFLMQGTGTLEEQLEAVKGKSSEVTARKGSLRKVEELGANIEEALIFDNR